MRLKMRIQDNNETRDIINWDYFNHDIPIVEVCEALGIEIGPNLTIHCPNPHHADNNPSCKLNPEKNVYHCFACGESGSPLNLVLSVIEGVSKEDLKALRSSGRNIEAVNYLKKAAYFLEELFPGGIKKEIVSKESNELPVPTIPKDILNELGFNVNPILYGQNIKIKDSYLSGKGGSFGSTIMINTDDYFLTKTEKAELLLDKLIAREEEIKREAKAVIAKYNLDKNGTRAVLTKTREDLQRIHPYLNAVKEYYFEQSERDFPADNFMEEVDKELSLEEER